jgi:ParB-like chromosome segregation protein Spo0J
MQYKLHPACDAWPQMSEDALAKLAEDIKANGLREPATITTDGLMLDGRNRALACERVGVKLNTVVFKGSDMVAFVISKNLHRRHLPKRDLAFIGAALARIRHGSNQHEEKVDFSMEKSTSNKTIPKIAADLGVGKAIVSDAKAINEKASPNVREMAKSGKIGLRDVAAYARNTSKAEQETADEDAVRRKGAAINGRHIRHDKPKKAPRDRTRKLIDPPFNPKPLPSGEDLIGLDPNQRVHLHPLAVKQMLNAEGLTTMMASAINNVAGGYQPDGPAFFEAIDLMLAWKPRPGGLHGWQTDFARKAKNTLARLDKSLDIALARLNTYKNEIERRKEKAA